MHQKESGLGTCSALPLKSIKPELYFHFAGALAHDENSLG
jgi:hypothetical protein